MCLYYVHMYTRATSSAHTSHVGMHTLTETHTHTRTHIVWTVKQQTKDCGNDEPLCALCVNIEEKKCARVCLCFIYRCQPATPHLHHSLAILNVVPMFTCSIPWSCLCVSVFCSSIITITIKPKSYRMECVLNAFVTQISNSFAFERYTHRLLNAAIIRTFKIFVQRRFNCIHEGTFL